VIEEKIKTHPKLNPEKTNKKQLKNPCGLHNGGHELDDCRQNPKNQKNEDKKNENARSRNSNGNNNHTREENRCTKRDGQQPTGEHHCSRSSSNASDDENEFHCITDRLKRENKGTPSSEILVAIPEKKGSKKYNTYLSLVDSGWMGYSYRHLQTDGSVQVKSNYLPQFTRKRQISTSFHMFT
jgi:hypothetical protein